MKYLFLVAIFVCAALAEDKKFLPNQASNDDIELHGTVILARDEITKAVGAELPEGYVAVRIKVTPKIGKPMRISADDFTLLSRKDGERSSALAPSQIAGRGGMVLHPAAKQPSGLGTTSSGPIWGGLGGAQPQRMPGGGGGLGNSAGVESGVSDATIDTGKGQAENPLLVILKDKILADVETKDPVEGLLYFVLEGKKLKPKDLGMIYKGTGGRLVIDFQ